MCAFISQLRRQKKRRIYCQALSCSNTPRSHQFTIEKFINNSVKVAKQRVGDARLTSLHRSLFQLANLNERQQRKHYASPSFSLNPAKGHMGTNTFDHKIYRRNMHCDLPSSNFCWLGQSCERLSQRRHRHFSPPTLAFDHICNIPRWITTLGIQYDGVLPYGYLP